MRGQSLHLIKMTVMQMLAMLNSNDYVNAIWYNSRFGRLSSCFDGFLPANTRNKRVRVFPTHLSSLACFNCRWQKIEEGENK